MNNNKNLILIANWKLNGNKNLLNLFFKKINENINLLKNNIKILISPPLIYLDYAFNLFKNSKNIHICSQHIDLNNKGPYTGETSSYMLKEIGIFHVIIGHSERRKLHNESNNKILKKIILSKLNNLIPILCIGENKNDYLNNKSLQKCLNQIKFLIKYSNTKLLYGSFIAYEPIWSIGTNINANIDHINYIIDNILKYLNKIDKNINNNINILYGGSVSSKNIKELLKINNINGFIIGNSSLNINEFLNIIKNLN